MGQHDSGYKLLFSYPHLVESLIRGFVPGNWIGQLDFASLEPVSEAHPRDNLSVRYDDVIWRLRWRSSWMSSSFSPIPTIPPLHVMSPARCTFFIVSIRSS